MMQQIVLNFHNVEDRIFVLRVSGKDILVDSLTEQIPIDAVGEDAVEISIYQQRKKKTPIIFHIAWFATILFQGLFNIFMLYSDDTWYKQINPYLMNAKLLIDSKGPADVHISFKDYQRGLWLQTFAECKQAKNIQILHHVYSDGIFNAYISYVKKVISISSVGIAFFGWVLSSLITKANASGIQICVMIICSIVLLDVLMIISQFWKTRKLQEIFSATSL